MSTDIEKFLSSGKYKYKINEPLSKHTTLGIGGNADFFVEVETEEKLCDLLKFINKNKIKFFILGGGTNTLFSDDGFKGIIIKLLQSNNFNKIGILDDWKIVINNKDTELPYSEELAMTIEIISVAAAASLQAVVKQTAEQGLSGFEYLAGIPGTVGGAIFGNAGVKEWSISDNLIKIEIVDFDGNKKILEKKNINFEYRKSNLSNCIITRAFFRLKKTDKNDILNVVLHELEKRKLSQPIGVKSAGCVFKNPQNDSAGRLIDSLSLKNYNIGEIEISAKHANFFVNKSNGTAKDMLELISFVKKKVFEKYNIRLETEIRMVK